MQDSNLNPFFSLEIHLKIQKKEFLNLVFESKILFLKIEFWLWSMQDSNLNPFFSLPNRKNCRNLGQFLSLNDKPVGTWKI